jgi:DHA2 family multidrug resistance protein
VLAQLASAGQSPDQAAATISRMVDQQAYTMAVTDLFYLSAGLFVALVVVVWLASPMPLNKAGKPSDGGGAH